MSESVTKEWCSQVRDDCRQRQEERFNAMKELFLSKLEGISDQLEVSLVDLQKSLSAGSRRMSDMEKRSKADRDSALREVKDVHLRLDKFCSEVKILMSEKVENESSVLRSNIRDVNIEVEKLKRPPWELITILVLIILTVGSSLALTWRQVGVLEYSMRTANDRLDHIEKKVNDGNNH